MPQSSHPPTIGLALGGGGARGLAHIGVLKALERAGIPVDVLAGTSMGGLVAAFYAAGRTPAEIEAEALHLGKLTHLLNMVDLGLPRRAFLSGDKLFAYLREKLGPWLTFAQLRRTLALTAVDLVSGKEVILRDGLVPEAVRATISLPGVLEPVERNGQYLVDGGVLNSVPADQARALGADVVIAVNVSLDVHDDRQWQKVGLPTILLDSWRADSISAAALTDVRLALARPEILLCPPISSEITTLTGFTRVPEIIAAGEAAVQEALPLLRSLVQR
jgi:NTE family protein